MQDFLKDLVYELLQYVVIKIGQCQQIGVSDVELDYMMFVLFFMIVFLQQDDIDELCNN